MPIATATVTQIVSGSPQAIYDVIIDYEKAHPAILPKPQFASLEVEKGGQGDGTELKLTMKVFGSEQVFYQVVTIPEPGRVVVETNKETGLATTFIIDPTSDPNQAKVTITTDYEVRSGFGGFIEKQMAQSFLSRLYKKELQLLEQYLDPELV